MTTGKRTKRHHKRTCWVRRTSATLTTRDSDLTRCADSLGIKGLPGIFNDRCDDVEAAEDDDEFADDPVSQMDFRAALRDCLQHFVQQTGEQRTNELAAHLSAEEQRALQQAMMER